MPSRWFTRPTVGLAPLPPVPPGVTTPARHLPIPRRLATTLEIEEATIGGLAMAVGMTTASHKNARPPTKRRTPTIRCSQRLGI